MNKTYLQKLISLICFSGIALFVNAQISDALLKSLEIINPENLNVEEAKKTKSLWETVQYLKNHELKQSRFNSTVRFGLHGDEAEDRSLYVANAGLNFKKGFYPGELSVSSSVRVRLDNNVFRENVSTLRMTYDYNFTPETEGYVFLDRFTDNFMNIDQRYELGGGMILPIFGGWSDDNLIPKGDEIIDKLELVDLDTSHTLSDSEWFDVWENKVNDDNTDWDESDRNGLIQAIKKHMVSLKKSRDNAEATTVKKYAKWRKGFLLGITSETEIANLSGTFLTQSGEEILFEEQANKHTWRWTIRPTLDIHPNEFLTIKFRPYFKMPMPWEWKEKVRSGDFSDDKVDWRIDLQSSFKVSFPSRLWNQNRVIAFTFSYRYLKDFSPPRLFLKDLGTNGEPFFLEARGTHHIVSMGFSVSFN